MTAIRVECKLNPNTTLIDAEMNGLKGGVSLYLIEGENESCLIDAGTKSSAPVIYEKLKKMNAWPPDKIIITHSHFDHSQGVVFLRKKAEEEGKSIEIMASEKGIPFLKDQSYNSCFIDHADQEPYINIEGVSPLKDGDTVNLGPGHNLKIVEAPGHMIDNICIYDEKNQSIFVGDTIGIKFTENFMLCNANSPYWDEDGYFKTIAKLKKINSASICLGHFGCIIDEEAKTILDESLSTYKVWMAIFEKNRDKLNDIPYLEGILWNQVYNHMPLNFRKAASERFQTTILYAVNSFKGR